MPRALDDARLKVVRAEKHLHDLRKMIATTVGSEIYGVAYEVDPQDPDSVILRVRLQHPPDPQFGVVLGDFLNNCRAALDYVMTALNRGRTRNCPRYFPLYDSKADFVREAIPKLRQLPDSEAALIESLQPFQGVQRPIRRHPGSMLRRLSNADKHRLLAVAAITTDRVLVTVKVDGQVVQKSLLEVDRYVEDDATLGRINKPPFPFQDMEVEVEWRSRLIVEGELPISAVVEPIMTWVRDDVLARFEPILRKLP